MRQNFQDTEKLKLETVPSSLRCWPPKIGRVASPPEGGVLEALKAGMQVEPDVTDKQKPTK